MKDGKLLTRSMVNVLMAEGRLGGFPNENTHGRTTHYRKSRNPDGGGSLLVTFCTDICLCKREPTLGEGGGGGEVDSSSHVGGETVLPWFYLIHTLFSLTEKGLLMMMPPEKVPFGFSNRISTSRNEKKSP